jgi:hypothetical protein
MKSLDAYAGILLAETFIELGLTRKAEKLLLAAAPVFEEQGMVADAVATVSLLREAIRRRKLDPQTLRELRDRMQGDR